MNIGEDSNVETNLIDPTQYDKLELIVSVTCRLYHESQKEKLKGASINLWWDRNATHAIYIFLIYCKEQRKLNIEFEWKVAYVAPLVDEFFLIYRLCWHYLIFVCFDYN